MTSPRTAWVCALTAVLLLAGCHNAGSPATTKSSSATPPGASVPTTAAPTSAPAAEPGIAGVPDVAPAGQVVPIGNAPEGLVIGTSGVGAVAVRDPDGVVLFDAATGKVRQTVPTRGAARHLGLAAPDGPVLVPLEGSNELSEVTLADGSVRSTATGVGHQPHDAVRTSDGTIVVTNELGGGAVFVGNGQVVASLPAGPPQPGGVAAVGGYAAVADVQGNGVWVYDGASRQLVAQAPVGLKLTHAVALTGDLAGFADTDGGAVFLDRITPQVTQVARIDAPGKPYGLAYDPAHRRLYVTLSTSNTLRVVDIADPAKPRMLGDLPTVQQPNSAAVDPRTGAVLITGSDPGDSSSLQIISSDLLPAR